MTTLDLDREDTLRHIDEALDSLLVLRVVIGGLPGSLPHHGFDRALMDEACQEARARFGAAWDALMTMVPEGEANPVALALEAACNQVAVATAEAAWKLAMAAGAGRIHERRDD